MRTPRPPALGGPSWTYAVQHSDAWYDVVVMWCGALLNLNDSAIRFCRAVWSYSCTRRLARRGRRRGGAVARARAGGRVYRIEVHRRARIARACCMSPRAAGFLATSI